MAPVQLLAGGDSGQERIEFLVTYEIPPTRAIHFTTVRAVDIEDAMNVSYRLLGSVRIRSVVEKQEEED